MVDVIIVNCNCARYTLGAVASLVGAADLGRIVVVDSGSEPSDLEILVPELASLEAYPLIDLVLLPTNLGFGAANNAGFARTASPYILLLNPDTIVHPGALAAAARVLDERADAAIAACRLLNRDGSLQPSWYSLPTPLSFVSEYLLRRWRPRPLPTAGGPYEVGGVSGAFMLLRRAAVPASGLFDEGYFMYAEEVDLCARVRANGWVVLYSPSASVTHFGGGSSGGARQRPSLYLEMQRSRLRYARRHFPRPWPALAGAAVKLGTALDLMAGLLRTAVGRQGWSEVRDRAMVYPAIWRL